MSEAARKYVTETLLAPLVGNHIVYDAASLKKAADQYRKNSKVIVTRGFGGEKLGKLLSVRILNGQLEGVVELERPMENQ